MNMEYWAPFAHGFIAGSAVLHVAILALKSVISGMTRACHEIATERKANAIMKDFKDASAEMMANPKYERLKDLLEDPDLEKGRP